MPNEYASLKHQFCGIDEAGLGPLLGPLLTASFRCNCAPNQLQDLLEDLGIWPKIKNSKASVNLEKLEAPAFLAHKLRPVADSKQIYRSTGDFARLELLALSIYFGTNMVGQLPLGRTEVLLSDIFSPSERVQLRKLEWYRGLFGTHDHAEQTLALAADIDQIHQQATKLHKALQDRGWQLFLHSLLLSECEYNHLIALHDNKGLVLRHLIGQLIRNFADSLDTTQDQNEEPTNSYCTVDRLGGLKYYLPWLGQLFGCPKGSHNEAIQSSSLLGPSQGAQQLGTWQVKLLCEGQDCSEYQLQYPNPSPNGEQELDPKWQQSSHQKFTIGFWVKGDRRNILCALASVWAKYRRELLLRQFNRYWQNQVSGTPATTGYYCDATVFLKFLEEHLGRLPPNLRRSR